MVSVTLYSKDCILEIAINKEMDCRMYILKTPEAGKLQLACHPVVMPFP